MADTPIEEVVEPTADEIELAADEPVEAVVAVEEPVEEVALAADEPKKKRRGKNAAADEVVAADEPSADEPIEEIAVAADEPKAKKRRGKNAAADEVVAADEPNADEPIEELVVAAEAVTTTSKKRRGKKSDEIAADVEAASDVADEIAEPEVADELVADAELSAAEEIPDELVAEMAADELRAEGDGAGDDSPQGDDVVGEQITDEAGVEAALLPGGLSAVQLRHLIEALVFAADKPVTVQRLRQLTRVSDVTRIEAALAELQDDYKERGIALQQVSGGYQFRTNTTFSSWVQQLIAGRPVRLSRAQLETLAIVAYRQPITRPEIDEIRGVDSSATLRLLLERSLIRVLGKREEVGRPTLYGTTKEFLDFFSLSDLRELPTLREYSELTAESRQVMSDRLGVPLDANGELIEPEAPDEVEADLDVPQDNASIVDSILAEHAAAEAEAESRFDASAMLDGALSGSDSFSDAMTADDDSMSLSGEVSSFGGSHVPASEARSYVDAIRASLVSDEIEGLGEIDDVEISADAPSGELEMAHVAHASESSDEHATELNAASETEMGHASESNDEHATELNAADETEMAEGHESVSSDEHATELNAATETEMARVGHASENEADAGDADRLSTTITASGHQHGGDHDHDHVLALNVASETEVAHVGHASESNDELNAASETEYVASESNDELNAASETEYVASESSDEHATELDAASETELAHVGQASESNDGHANELNAVSETEMAHVGHASDSNDEHASELNETEMAHGHVSDSNDEHDNELNAASETEMAHVGHTSESNDETATQHTDAAHVGHSDETGETNRDDAGIADTDAPIESPDSDSDDPEGN